jgi:hypothetical protein
MIRHRQLFCHAPENGTYGDCHRTAIACLLDLQPQDVPHFYQLKVEAQQRGEEFDWRAEVERFLNSKGYTGVDITYASSLNELFDYMAAVNPRSLYLLGGASPRGWNHTVICRGGGFEWDPHPDSDFVIGPLDSGLFEVTFLLPISMRADAANEVDHG